MAQAAARVEEARRAAEGKTKEFAAQAAEAECQRAADMAEAARRAEIRRAIAEEARRAEAAAEQRARHDERQRPTGGSVGSEEREEGEEETAAGDDDADDSDDDANDSERGAEGEGNDDGSTSGFATERQGGFSAREAESSAQSSRRSWRWPWEWDTAPEPPLTDGVRKPNQGADARAAQSNAAASSNSYTSTCAARDGKAHAADAENAAAEALARAQLTASASGQTCDSRDAKVVERDAAVKRILARSSRTLKDALGLKRLASETEVSKGVRAQLRLLHPDYSINLPLKGTKKHARIESAFKKLNSLRDQPSRSMFQTV